MKLISTSVALSANVVLAMSALMPSVEAGPPPLDRVLWTYQMQGNNGGWFLAVADDGTVYTTDHANLYALTPDGTESWIVPGAGGRRPITIDANGVIYTGNNRVFAINPDGTTRWQFVPASSSELVAGPGVGPDGNIYAAQKTTFDNTNNGLGFFALDPNGQPIWSNKSAFTTTGNNSKIVFNSDRLFASIEVNASSPFGMRAVRLDNGSVIWNSENLALFAVTHPQRMLDGRIASQWQGIGVTAITPDGVNDWITLHPDGNSVATPAVGPDGVIYSGSYLGIHLWALNPDGSIRWVLPNDPGQHLVNLSVSPNNTVIIVSGWEPFALTTANWIRGYATNDGTLLWQIDLATAGGGVPSQFVASVEPAYSVTGDTAYITVEFFGANLQSLVFAIDVTPNGQTVADLNGDGVVNGADLATLLTQWGTNGPADLNSDGVVNGADLATLLTNWG